MHTVADALMRREEELIALLGQLPVACMLLREADHTVVAVNPAFEALFGWSASRMIGRSYAELPLWSSSRQREDFRRQLLTSGRIQQHETHFQCGDGQTRPCLAYVEQVRIGDQLYQLATAHDMSERSNANQELKQSEAKFAALFIDSPEPYVLFSKRTAKIIEINHRFTQVFGYQSQDVIDRNANEFGFWRYPEKRPAVIDKLMREGCLRNEPVDLVAKDGRVLNCEVSSNFILVGEEWCTLSSFKDVTEQRRIEARVKHQAYHDALTDLPNRLLLHDRLQQYLALSERHGLSCALLFFDLDHFKRVNDSLGHGCGDAVLQEVSRRLQERVRRADTVARLGGDEFVILLTGLSGKPEQIAEQARVSAAELLEVVSAPMQIEGYGLQLSCSIGIALSSEHGNTPEDLLKHADTALYGVKASGRNNIAFFEPQMQVAVSQRLQLETELRNALLEGEFLLHYQPQVDACTQRITGAEALLRWQHPEMGMIGPGTFMPVLEESGMILEAGHWVLEQACDFIARLLDQRLIAADQFCLCVNISPRQFRQASFVAQVAAAIAQKQIPVQCLKLEITESIMIHNISDTVEKMNELRDMGIRFAIDDFGTGYSSLSYLKRLPVDLLKIDQSFIDDCTHDGNDAEIVRAIIAMARSLKMELIAEGVETAEQLAFLKQHGCRTYQGYYFSRAVSEEAFCALLGPPATR
ncbi:PAS domain S-box-containing protein/diguanylate cyclase (GGDEF) domain-containing protein [Marinobacter segnicrescens]|uniref:cyclic-guanylate-specific phosphodiesterase n=2 Tax=Marinobacter segnicrescens TaxID=430453 RepID=A0A1H9YFN8_9GAMM|nr:PAS domain S-box-containing protein/diguanylate cyclase (GGDEF) domain-containing protein [Marinobacter segnicrescens]